MSLRKGFRGFTLIEVVVAMAILGIGLVVIIELFGGGLRLGRTSEEYTRAVGYARMKLEEVSLSPSLEEGVQEGEFDRDFRWQMEVKKVNLLPPAGIETDYRPPVELFQINLQVLWNSGLREKTFGLESYRIFKTEERGQTS
jgi:general secretion pathway protein I